MTYKWLITIEAWPHSSGKGSVIDQEAAGERSRNYIVEAEIIQDALKLAEAIRWGILSNPAVWKAPIMGIAREIEKD